MNSSKIKFESASILDAKVLSIHHKNAFQDGFLRYLDVDILANNFYNVILQDDNFEIVKIIVDDEYAGLLVIKKIIHKKIKFDYWSLFKPILKVFISRPGLIMIFWSFFIRFLITLSKPSVKSISEIYVFYIVKDFQSQGIGTVALDKYFRHHKSGCYLVETNSMVAYQMYMRVGFKDLNSRLNLLGSNSFILLKTPPQG